MKLNLINTTKAIVYLTAITVISVLIILIPEILREEAIGKATPPAAFPVLIVSWTYSLPVFFALYQTLRLINLIELKKAFSNKTIETLQKIKYSTIIFCIMVIVGTAAGLVLGKRIDPTEDLTPLATFGFIFTFVSIVIATFVATLRRLLQNAINIKAENDLTV